jgi:copper transport protein
LAVAVAALSLSLCAAPSAHAHATLVSSTPADGSRVEVSPRVVTLRFDESVRLVAGATHVITDDGTPADAGDAHVAADGATVVIPLRPDLASGSYSAVWRVISADTHIVSGSIGFGVRQDARAPLSQGADPSRQLTVIDDVLQGILYLGLVLCVGVTFVCVTLWRWALALSRIRRLIWTGYALIGCETVLQFLFEGPRDIGGGWTDVFTADALSAALHSRTGVVLVARVVVLLGAAALTRRIINRSTDKPAEPDRRGVAMLVTGAAALTVSAAILGHAGAGGDSWLAIPVTAIHLLVMTAWLGGLITLVVAVLPRRDTDNLRRWSAMAAVCVGTLVLTGVYQAWRQIYPVAALWSTTYGITLISKLALVLGMLTLAYIARRRLAVERLRRTVPVEAALGLAVLAITTFLVSRPAARDTYGPAFATTAPLGTRTAEIHVSSTRRGPITIEVTPRGPKGTVAGANSVKGVLSSDDAGIAALPVSFTTVPVPSGFSTSPGYTWRSTYAVVPRAGRWTLTLTVEFSIKEAVVTSTRFRVW